MGSDDPGGAPVKHVARKASRFSKEFLATVISLVTTALGVVVALAWNTALSALFKQVFSEKAEIAALFVYAATVTAIGVFVIVALGRLATRLDTEPIEFKYPAKKEE